MPRASGAQIRDLDKPGCPPDLRPDPPLPRGQASPRLHPGYQVWRVGNAEADRSSFDDGSNAGLPRGRGSCLVARRAARLRGDVQRRTPVFATPLRPFGPPPPHAGEAGGNPHLLLTSSCGAAGGKIVWSPFVVPPRSGREPCSIQCSTMCHQRLIRYWRLSFIQ
jgi:hypothetical protein